MGPYEDSNEGTGAKPMGAHFIFVTGYVPQPIGYKETKKLLSPQGDRPMAVASTARPGSEQEEQSMSERYEISSIFP